MRQVPRGWSAVRVASLTVALVLAAVTTARAEFPALSRPFVLGSPALASAPPAVAGVGMRLSSDVWLGGFSRSLDPDTADPRAQKVELGGRVRASLARGRCDLSIDITQDTRYNVDSREYPARLSLGAEWPACLTARASIGYEDGVYDGADVELETRAQPLAPAGTPWRPRLALWGRVRKLDFERAWLFTPAAGLVIGEAGQGGHGVAGMFSVQWDAATDDTPSGFGMVSLRWISGTSQSDAADASMLGSPFGWQLERRWFLQGAYAFPLDPHQYARLAIGAGVGFNAPF